MFRHETVLLEETVDGLDVHPEGVYVDATLGGGGHSEYLLGKLTTGRLIAFDQDETAIKNAEEKFRGQENLTLIHSNFENLQEELERINVHKIDGVLYDLGVSSPQLDVTERGFSHSREARLDTRMDQSRGLDAHEIVNSYSYEQLVSIFLRYGEEKFTKKIAREIVHRRAEVPIETTTELTEIIKSQIPHKFRRTGGHPAQRVFQALRMAVNDELGVLERLLEDAIELLNNIGRISVITFNSLEDRICK